MDAAAAGRAAVQRRAPPTSEATTLPGGSPLFTPVADDSNKVLLEAMSPLQVGCPPACSATCEKLYVYPLTVLTGHVTGPCWAHSTCSILQRHMVGGVLLTAHRQSKQTVCCAERSWGGIADTAVPLCSLLALLNSFAANCCHVGPGGSAVQAGSMPCVVFQLARAKLQLVAAVSQQAAFAAAVGSQCYC